jgi:hypothetical protein
LHEQYAMHWLVLGLKLKPAAGLERPDPSVD